MAWTASDSVPARASRFLSATWRRMSSRVCGPEPLVTQERTRALPMVTASLSVRSPAWCMKSLARSSQSGSESACRQVTWAKNESSSSSVTPRWAAQRRRSLPAFDASARARRSSTLTRFVLRSRRSPRMGSWWSTARLVSRISSNGRPAAVRRRHHRDHERNHRPQPRPVGLAWSSTVAQALELEAAAGPNAPHPHHRVELLALFLLIPPPLDEPGDFGVQPGTRVLLPPPLARPLI